MNKLIKRIKSVIDDANLSDGESIDGIIEELNLWEEAYKQGYQDGTSVKGFTPSPTIINPTITSAFTRTTT